MAQVVEKTPKNHTVHALQRENVFNAVVVDLKTFEEEKSHQKLATFKYFVRYWKAQQSTSYPLRMFNEKIERVARTGI